MTHPPAGGDPQEPLEPREPRGIPRWLIIGGIVLIIALLLGIVVMLSGGGHAPRRHGIGPDATTPPAPSQGHRPPSHR